MFTTNLLSHCGWNFCIVLPSDASKFSFSPRDTYLLGNTGNRQHFVIIVAHMIENCVTVVYWHLEKV